MKKLKMYRITNKIVNIAYETNYKFSWVGREKLPNYLIIYETIDANNVNKIKLSKRELRSTVKDPSISFSEIKQNLVLHPDMYQGYESSDKAISAIHKKDRQDFKNCANISFTYNPLIIFIAKVIIHKKWFVSLFPRLERCKKIFNKYTNTKESPWIFLTLKLN
tara:strand:- start:702 stop:1193 length:492 start_codon:yes stop_codon:yes gene_type:complete